MGEQPIYNTRAHVFQIDPVTKKNWLPSSKQAVNVSFFFDSTRSSYRIISVDGSKAIINSTMVPQMLFTKTSQKFGQWADNRANIVYGLGFQSEAELNKFIEQFDIIKEKMKASPQDKKGDGGGDASITANGSTRASVTSTTDQPVIKHTKERSGDNTPIPLVPPSTSNDAQVRYENDRLKIALAQSSNNAKKWELELQTLKNNNARLTTALQESTSNVEEWKKQLSAYKEENGRLKQRLQEAPQPVQGTPSTTQDGPDSNLKQLQAFNLELEDKVQFLTLANKVKTEEVDELATRLQQVADMEEDGKKLREELQDSKDGQASLQQRVADLEDRLKREQTGRQNDTQRAQQLHLQLGNLIQELSGMHQDMAEIL